MVTIGLTGGVGMGKTTSGEFLAQRGVPIIDTDVLARQVVEPGEPALEEIRALFGPEVVDGAGRLRREHLANLVFADESNRKRLEAIVHPRIRERWLACSARWRNEGRKLGIVIIPLLFETGAENHFGKIVCTACSGVSQRERLWARKWTSDQIEKRIAAQWPAERKMALSDFVLWTEGALETHAAQVDCVLRTLDREGPR